MSLVCRYNTANEIAQIKTGDTRTEGCIQLNMSKRYGGPAEGHVARTARLDHVKTVVGLSPPSLRGHCDRHRHRQTLQSCPLPVNGNGRHQLQAGSPRCAQSHVQNEWPWGHSSVAKTRARTGGEQNPHSRSVSGTITALVNSETTSPIETKGKAPGHSVVFNN